MPSFLNFRRKGTNSTENSKFDPSTTLRTGTRNSKSKSSLKQLVRSFVWPVEMERVRSRFNGEIVVVKSEGEVRFLVDGLTQSGKFIDQIWRKAVNFLKKSQFKPSSCLILGLGGGTAAQLVQRAWPGIEIVGIEIDPMMVRLGKKYLKLGDIANLTIKIGDAISLINSEKKKYDLVLVDMYRGGRTPEWLPRVDQFLERLSYGGVVVFNLLFYTDDSRQQANNFVNGIKGWDVELLRELTNLLVVVKRRT